MLSTIHSIQTVLGANANGTLTIRHHANSTTGLHTLTGLPTNEEIDNDGYGVRAVIAHVRRTAISHRFEIEVKGCSTEKPVLLGLGILYTNPDVSMQDIMDWVRTGRAFSDEFDSSFG